MGTRAVSTSNIKIMGSRNGIPVGKLIPRHFEDYRDAERFIKKALGLKEADYTVFAPEQFNMLNDVLIEEYNFKPFKLYSVKPFGRFNVDDDDFESTNMMIDNFDINRPSLLINQRAWRQKFVFGGGRLFKEKIVSLKKTIVPLRRELYRLQDSPDRNEEEYRKIFEAMEKIEEDIEMYEKFSAAGYNCFTVSDLAKNDAESFRLLLQHEIAHVRQSNTGKMNLPRRHKAAARHLRALPEFSAYPGSYLELSGYENSYYDEKSAELYAVYRTCPETLTKKELKFVEVFFEL